MTRQELIVELERLEPSRSARAILLRKDDAGLLRTIERLRQVEAETRAAGHIAATGIGLRVVQPAPGE